MFNSLCCIPDYLTRSKLIWNFPSTWIWFEICILQFGVYSIHFNTPAKNYFPWRKFWTGLLAYLHLIYRLSDWLLPKNFSAESIKIGPKFEWHTDNSFKSYALSNSTQIFSYIAFACFFTVIRWNWTGTSRTYSRSTQKGHRIQNTSLQAQLSILGSLDINYPNSRLILHWDKWIFINLRKLSLVKSWTLKNQFGELLSANVYL